MDFISDYEDCAEILLEEEWLPRENELEED
jgi:hypothetical protein